LLVECGVNLMSAEHTEEVAEPQAAAKPPESVAGSNSDKPRNEAADTHNGKPNDADQEKEAAPPATPVSPVKLRAQSRLPALDDDADVGVQKEHTVTRDGKADLLFTGELLASAAPATALKGHWQEFRIYQTNGGKHVFSKASRSVFEEPVDTYEAEVFDPAPNSVPSHLIRSVREIARAKPLTWMDAAVSFFGYDPLAKALYRKLSAKFEEQIS